MHLVVISVSRSLLQVGLYTQVITAQSSKPVGSWLRQLAINLNEPIPKCILIGSSDLCARVLFAAPAKHVRLICSVEFSL